MRITADVIDNLEDIIDSRSVIDRIEELIDIEGEELTDDEREELVALTALAAEGEDYASDWAFGTTLIRDSYFTEYAEQLAEEVGAIDHNAEWPSMYIDWETAAQDLQQDYSLLDFDGVEYWVRS